MYGINCQCLATYANGWLFYDMGDGFVRTPEARKSPVVLEV